MISCIYHEVHKVWVVTWAAYTMATPAYCGSMGSSTMSRAVTHMTQVVTRLNLKFIHLIDMLKSSNVTVLWFIILTNLQDVKRIKVWYYTLRFLFASKRHIWDAHMDKSTNNSQNGTLFGFYQPLYFDCIKWMFTQVGTTQKHEYNMIVWTFGKSKTSHLF